VHEPPKPSERIVVLEGRLDRVWEGSGVLNPGVQRVADGRLAMVYRGCGSDNVGYLGFCYLDPDGRHVIHGTRTDAPLNIPSGDEAEVFPGGYGDPRMNRVGDVFYVWANGRNNAVLSRNRARFQNDFSKQYVGGRQTVLFRTTDFTSLEYLGLHGPDEFDKNAFLHPDTVPIDGREFFAQFHRMKYSIQVAKAPRIEDFGRRDLWKAHVQELDLHCFMSPLFGWEGKPSGTVSSSEWPGSVAGGAPPIKIGSDLIPFATATEEHWLMFYNGSGHPRPGGIALHRRIGAVIYKLDPDRNPLSQPFQIVARSPEPILQPYFPHEFDCRDGDVVFATAAVLTPDETAVDVFHASGDMRIGKARFDLPDLVSYLCQFDGLGRARN